MNLGVIGLGVMFRLEERLEAGSSWMQLFLREYKCMVGWQELSLCRKASI